MNIDDLIKELQVIRDKFGNIPIYHWVQNDEGYDDLWHYDGEGLDVKKMYLMKYISEYYDFHEDDVVEFEKSEINSAEFGEKLDEKASDIHVGLIL